MSSPSIVYKGKTTEFGFDISVLNGQKLNLCMVQTSIPHLDLVEGDSSRPESISALQHLLDGGGNHPQAVLTEMIPRSDFVLLIAPEFAFGFVDWTSIDALVRKSKRPLIVVAGFGASKGKRLRDWVDISHEDDLTHRHLSWCLQDGPLSNSKPVNGGWCWVHQPGIRTDCITFLKNTAEQAHEAVKFPNMQYGKEVLHIKFNDLDYFPLICADMLCSVTANQNSAQAKIKEALQVDDRAKTPVLVTGSLWQQGYNTNWEAAIGDILNHVMIGRPGAVALCNVAYDVPSENEESDKWRSLSGVYVKFTDHPKKQKNLPAGRALGTASISGVVIRESGACAAGGQLGWSPFNPIDGNFIWHPDVLYKIADTGLVPEEELSVGPFSCEIQRYLRRFPSKKQWNPCVAEGIELIKIKAATSDEKQLSRFVASILHGIDLHIKTDPDDLHSHDVCHAYLDGIYAIATLKTLDGIEWQNNIEQLGHMVSSGKRNILVWNERELSSKALIRKIEVWLTDTAPHPALIIFAGNYGGTMKEGQVKQRRRTDITTSTPKAEIEITSPRNRRRAACYSLTSISDAYLDFDPSELNERTVNLSKIISTAFQELSS
ncbi:ABC-three component system protein [Pseudomonas sp. S2_H08]